MSNHSNAAIRFYSQFAALQSFSGDSHPADMPSFNDGSQHAFILPAIACLEKHERHRILCYDTGLVVCEENPDPMLHNSMYLCM